MVLAADFALGEALWAMFVFFLWFIWIMLLFHVFGDLFRDHETSGVAKALWTIFIICVPYLGVFVYLILREGMAERSVAQQQAAKTEFDAYVRDAAEGGAAAEIAHAKKLLDDGAISQEEFEQLKRKAMA